MDAIAEVRSDFNDIITAAIKERRDLRVSSSTHSTVLILMLCTV